jgi:hypothetical protein
MYEYRGYMIVICKTTACVDVYGHNGYISSFATEADAEEYINTL